MNSIAIQRIAWKEFRQQRLFFFAILIVALPGFLLSPVFTEMLGSEIQHSNRWPAMILGLFSALYAAGCGATLFATEKEERTFFALQLLPLTSRQLLTGKLSVAVGLCAIVCMAAFFVVWISGLLESAMFFGRTSGWIGVWLKTFGLATIEFFAWSVLFSLLLNNPLLAATLGIFAASFTIQSCALFTHGYLTDQFELRTYAQAFWPRCLLAAVILAVDFWIARRWLNGGLVVDAKQRRLFENRTEEQTSAVPVAGATSRPSHRRIFGRFFWQALRSSWPLMLAWCLLLPVCLPFGLSTGRIEIGMVILMFVAAVAGVFAFSYDKTTGGAAFLAHHGERPGLYWLANVLLWIGWLILVNLAIALVALVIASVQDSALLTTHGRFAFYRNRIFNELSSEMGVLFSTLLSATWLTIGMVFSFAAGHLCSILIERRILATMAALVVCVPVTIWYALMLASETPLFWSVFPLFAALMAGGCLATRWWIGNRKTWFRIAPLLGSILLVWTGLAWMVVQKRTTEIPVVEFDIAAYRKGLGEPDAKLLAEMQRRFAAARDGYTLPEKIYPLIVERYPEILDALRGGANGQLNEQVYKSLRDTLVEFAHWSEFAGNSNVELRDIEAVDNPKIVEHLVEIASLHLEENRQRLDQLAEAILFAAENVNEAWKMEPYFRFKSFYSGEPAPPLGYKEDSSRTLLELDFFDTVRRGDSREAWQRLKLLLLFESIHRLIYARNDGFGDLASYIDNWIEMDGLDRMDVMDALELSTQGFLRPVYFQRELERSYLANAQVIQHRTWVYDGKTWGSQPTKDEFFKEQLFDWFPWERERSMRLLNLWTAWQSMQFEIPQGSQHLWTGVHNRWLNAYGFVVPNFENWVDNTILPLHQDGQFFVKELLQQSPRNRDPYRSIGSMSWRNTAIRAEQISEILRLRLAAIAWQLTYGSMPENLQQLEGPDFNVALPSLLSIDNDGDSIRLPKYELVPKRPGAPGGDRYIVHANSNSDRTVVDLSLARVPYVVGNAELENE